MRELIDIPDEELPPLWCKLNVGEWPPELAGRPINLDLLDSQEHHKAIWTPMAEIMRRVPHKELLREWNKDRMTPEEFESWWTPNR